MTDRHAKIIKELVKEIETDLVAGSQEIPLGKANETFDEFLSRTAIPSLKRLNMYEGSRLSGTGIKYAPRAKVFVEYVKAMAYGWPEDW